MSTAREDLIRKAELEDLRRLAMQRARAAPDTAAQMPEDSLDHMDDAGAAAWSDATDPLAGTSLYRSPTPPQAEPVNDGIPGPERDHNDMMAAIEAGAGEDEGVPREALDEYSASISHPPMPSEESLESRASRMFGGSKGGPMVKDPPEAEYPVERPEDSILRSDQMQGADEIALPPSPAVTDPGAQGYDDASRTTRDRGTSLSGLGARVPGTLDMSRPFVQMPDGTGATVRSASFGTDDGEVLLPTISPDGREWTNAEALDAYRHGGGHLGIYGSPDEATSAALRIHDSEDAAPTVGAPKGTTSPDSGLSRMFDHLDPEAMSGGIMRGLVEDGVMPDEAPPDDPEAMAAFDAAMAAESGDETMDFTAADADRARADSGVDAPMYTPAIDPEALTGELYGEAEDALAPPDDEAMMAVFDADEAAMSGMPEGEEAPTEWDAMSAGLLGRSLPGGDAVVGADAETPGYPADDNEAVEAALGIDDNEADELGPSVPMEGPPGSPAKGERSEDYRPIDNGLPSEGDINTARDWDIVRQITGRLGNALRVMGGGSHRDIVELAPGMRDARREGIDERMGRKNTTETAGRTAAAAAAREERLAAAAERTAGLTERRLGITEADMARRGGLAERELASTESLGDPRSDESARARERFSATLDAMSEANPTMAAMAESYRARLEGLSANDVRRLEDTLGITTRPATGRGAGGGGGVSGGASSAARRQAFLDLGLATEENVDERLAALPTRSEVSAITGAMGRGDTATGEALLYVDGPDGHPRPIRGMLEMNPTARREFYNSHRTMVGAGGALREVERIASERGAGERAISPEVAAAIAPSMMRLRSLAANIQGTGVINPSEMAAINAALPDPTRLSGMTFGAFEASVNAWRRSVAESMNASMEAAGVEAADRRELIARVIASGGRAAEPAARSAPAAAPSGGDEEMVRVRSPDGRVGRIPTSRVDAAVARGAEVIP